MTRQEIITDLRRRLTGNGDFNPDTVFPLFRDILRELETTRPASLEAVEAYARIIWETWVREKDSDISWEDAYLYAPEDAACVQQCASQILALPSGETLRHA